MLAQQAPSPPSALPEAHPEMGGMPLLVAADLQDHLMVARNDLDRLQRLLVGACDGLIGSFYGATAELKGLLLRTASQPELDAPQLHAAMEHLAAAITAMQFQDMASQLLDHTTRRLVACADLLAAETMGDDEDGSALIACAPVRPNPVTQDEMDAGSIELF